MISALMLTAAFVVPTHWISRQNTDEFSGQVITEAIAQNDDKAFFYLGCDANGLTVSFTNAVGNTELKNYAWTKVDENNGIKLNGTVTRIGLATNEMAQEKSSDWRQWLEQLKHGKSVKFRLYKTTGEPIIIQFGLGNNSDLVKPIAACKL